MADANVATSQAPNPDAGAALKTPAGVVDPRPAAPSNIPAGTAPKDPERKAAENPPTGTPFPAIPPTEAEQRAALRDDHVRATAAMVEETLAKNRKHKIGDKVRLFAGTHEQVNPLTNQTFPVGSSVKAVIDRWIELQMDAGVLREDSDD